MTGEAPSLVLVAPEAPAPAVARPVRLTRALERVLRKALPHPIGRAGHAGGRERGAWRCDDLDRPRLVDRAIARGWLATTWAFNRYALTEAGRGRLQALDKIRAGRKKRLRD